MEEDEAPADDDEAFFDLGITLLVLLIGFCSSSSLFMFSLSTL